MIRVKLYREFLNENRKHPILPDKIAWMLEASVNGTWNLNDKGEIDVDGDVSLMELNYEKFPVKFGIVTGTFNCHGMKQLKTLEGAPYEVGGVFKCSRCISLNNFEGAPQKAISIAAQNCLSIISLKGLPEEIPGTFIIDGCINLESLEHGPKSVGRDYSCIRCEKIESLEGIAKKIGRDLYMQKCKNLKTIEELQHVKVEGAIIIEGNDNMEKSSNLLANDHKLLRMWLKSGLSIKEFLHEKRGTIAAKNFGF